MFSPMQKGKVWVIAKNFRREPAQYFGAQNRSEDVHETADAFLWPDGTWPSTWSGALEFETANDALGYIRENLS